jgi:hypothetical protein
VAGHAEIIPVELAYWSMPEAAQQMVADPTWRSWPDVTDELEW